MSRPTCSTGDDAGAEPTMRVWSCKIGTREHFKPSPFADLPMRRAVEAAFKDVAGVEAEFNFSGWGYQLEEMELAVVENRQPSEEHYRKWRMQDAAPEMLAALEEARRAIVSLDEGALGYVDGMADANTGEGIIYPLRDELLAQMDSAIRKATGEPV